MAHLYFHCSSARGTLIDPVGLDLPDLGDACSHAASRLHLANRTEECAMPLGQFTSQLGRDCHQPGTVMGRVRKLVRTVRHPYRPELHYMRGPGPKWHAKNGSLTGSALLS